MKKLVIDGIEGKRKAWLFSDTPAGADASAIIYSLVETAKANGIEPYTWLRHVLEHRGLACGCCRRLRKNCRTSY